MAVGPATCPEDTALDRSLARGWPAIAVDASLTVVPGSLTVVRDSIIGVELATTVVDASLTMVTGSLTVVGDSITGVELAITVVDA